MNNETIFIGYNENGIPIFETICKYESTYIGICHDEEGRAVPIYA